MNLHTLSKITTKSKKRLGRGLGSGKGKTAGRGTKGQKARGKVATGFIGGTLPIYKKLPFRRGLGNPKVSTKMAVLPLEKLNYFAEGKTVDLESLISEKLVSKSTLSTGVKIVDGGEVSKALTVKLPTTAKAAAKIKDAGGQVVNG